MFNRFGNGFWPRYRGKGAGRLVRVKEQLQRRGIDIVQSSQIKRYFFLSLHFSLSSSPFSSPPSFSSCLVWLVSTYSSNMVLAEQNCAIPGFSTNKQDSQLRRQHVVTYLGQIACNTKQDGSVILGCPVFQS